MISHCTHISHYDADVQLFVLQSCYRDRLWCNYEEQPADVHIKLRPEAVCLWRNLSHPSSHPQVKLIIMGKILKTAIQIKGAV